MLLITGGTGLVGGLLTSMLPGKIVSLARGHRVNEGELRWVRGDLAVDGLGLEAATARWLQQSVTGIVHCAAEIRFTRPIEEARLVNATGTARMLEFARGCPHLRHFAHVSTAYVFGAEQGTLPEGRAHASHWVSSYEQSKYEAEELVLDAAATLPAEIYRLSSIIGDAGTGRVRQFNYAHQLLRLMPRQLLPAIPGDADARMDIIPSDVSAAALAHLIGRHPEPGTVWNICAGPERTWRLCEIIDAVVAGYQRHGHSVRAPRLISPLEFGAMLTRVSRLSQELATVTSHFLPHLALRQTFACDRTHAALDGAGIEIPHIRTYFHRVMDYCFESGWGNRAMPECADEEMAAEPT